MSIQSPGDPSPVFQPQFETDKASDVKLSPQMKQQISKLAQDRQQTGKNDLNYLGRAVEQCVMSDEGMEKIQSFMRLLSSEIEKVNDQLNSKLTKVKIFFGIINTAEINSKALTLSVLVKKVSSQINKIMMIQERSNSQIPHANPKAVLDALNSDSARKVNQVDESPDEVDLRTPTWLEKNDQPSSAQENDKIKAAALQRSATAPPPSFQTSANPSESLLGNSSIASTPNATPSASPTPSQPPSPKSARQPLPPDSPEAQKERKRYEKLLEDETYGTPQTLYDYAMTLANEYDPKSREYFQQAADKGHEEAKIAISQLDALAKFRNENARLDYLAAVANTKENFFPEDKLTSDDINELVEAYFDGKIYPQPLMMPMYIDKAALAGNERALTHLAMKWLDNAKGPMQQDLRAQIENKYAVRSAEEREEILLAQAEKYILEDLERQDTIQQQRQQG